ncbi:MAG: thiamine pyrophosphokinase [Actinomycetaceae bacterium]|nr:thiamine pyrophosphokinase [Arcanobacterium sp.]MDD7505021.1 thiamine pyrophosphokinase [Actinomycetaceae bacterium]MDY6143732.1 thiamine pyrophosphokinase [Arcanobacterium sp.]
MGIYADSSNNEHVQRRCVIVSAAPINDYRRARSFLMKDVDTYFFADAGLAHASPLGITPDVIVGDFDSLGSAEQNTYHLQRSEAIGLDEEHARKSTFQSPATSASTPIEEPALPKAAQEPEVFALPRSKDVTDTFFAVEEGLRRGFTDFVLIGATGGRFDHTYANVQILAFLANRGARGFIVDDVCEMSAAFFGNPCKLTPRGFLSLEPHYSAHTPLLGEQDGLPGEQGSAAKPNAPSPTNSHHDAIPQVLYFSVLATSGSAAGVSIHGARYELENATLASDFQLGVSNEILPGHTAVVTSTSPVIVVAVRQAQPALH